MDNNKIWLPTDEIQRLKQNIDIVEFYSEYLNLKRCGSGYSTCCPFHQDRHPSMSINIETGLFKCWSIGCQEHGDVIDFYRKFNKLSFMDAITGLAEKYGIELNYDSEYAEYLEKVNGLYSTNKKVLSYYRRNLNNNHDAQKYLQNRHITVDTINKFKVGTTLDHDLYQVLKDEVDNLKQLSLIQNMDSEPLGDTHFRDFFRFRIVIPYLNEKSQILGFIGRVMDDKYQPKYLNSHKSPIFDKTKALFGIHIAKPYIEEYKNVLLVEGQIDCMMAHQYGLNNCVAVGGTSLSKEQIQYLARLTKNFFICFDVEQNQAGEKGMEKLYQSIIEVVPYAKVRIIELPSVQEKMDLDLFLRKYGKGEFLNIAKKSLLYNEYAINKVLKTVNYKTLEDKKFYVYQLKDHLNSITNFIDKKQYIELISNKLNIPENDIYWILKQKSQPKQVVKPQYESRYSLSSKMIIALLFSDYNKENIVSILDSETIEELLDEAYIPLYKLVRKMVLAGNNKTEIINSIFYEYQNHNTVKDTVTDILFKSEEVNCYSEDVLDAFIMDQIKILKQSRKARNVITT